VALDGPRRRSTCSAILSAVHTVSGIANKRRSHRTSFFTIQATARRYPAPTCFTRRVAVTLYGVCAVTFMMIMYALERRGRGYVLGFALGCVLSSAYGFLSGAWPFGVVELIWAGVALRRYRETAPA
jgi:hypothetical protein